MDILKVLLVSVTDRAVANQLRQCSYKSHSASKLFVKPVAGLKLSLGWPKQTASFSAERKFSTVMQIAAFQLSNIETVNFIETPTMTSS